MVGPHHAAALVALDLGDVGEDARRRFDYVVIEAARSLLHWLTPVRPLAPDHAGRVLIEAG